VPSPEIAEAEQDVAPGDSAAPDAALRDVFVQVEESTAKDVVSGFQAIAGHLRSATLAILNGFAVQWHSPGDPIAVGWLDASAGHHIRFMDLSDYPGLAEPDTSAKRLVCFVRTEGAIEVFTGYGANASAWSQIGQSAAAPPDMKAVLRSLGVHRMTGIEFVSDAERLLTERTLLLAAAMVGTVQAIFRYVVSYSKRRVTFGKAICHHQAVALKLADAAICIESCRLLCLQACVQPTLEQVAQLVQYVGGCLAEAGISLAQLMGGHGFLELYPIPGLLRALNHLQFLVAQARRFSEAK
jgi:hypothetical protein